MDIDRKRGLIPVTADKLSVQVAVNSWRLILERANKTLSNLTDDQLLKEVAPGRNRLIYLLGHLTAIHDAMFPILGLGERLHPELDAIFVSSPDTDFAHTIHTSEKVLCCLRKDNASTGGLASECYVKQCDS